jgi:hypothetical protein
VANQCEAAREQPEHDQQPTACDAVGVG